MKESFYISDSLQALYLNLLEPFVMADPTDAKNDVPLDYNIQFQEFVQNTPKR